MTVVGARPCSAGGGFHLSKAVEAVYGPVSLEASSERIVQAAADVPADQPLIVMAHCGPSGLGSEAASPCGRDWKTPAVDWGDQDLALALDRMANARPADLVIFGHMHHRLRHGAGQRRTVQRDRQGTVYLNAACVPRHGIDASGRPWRHFSWVELDHNGDVQLAAHRWYGLDGELLEQQVLLDSGGLVAP